MQASDQTENAMIVSPPQYFGNACVISFILACISVCIPCHQWILPSVNTIISEYCLQLSNSLPSKSTVAVNTLSTKNIVSRYPFELYFICKNQEKLNLSNAMIIRNTKRKSQKLSNWNTKQDLGEKPSCAFIMTTLPLNITFYFSSCIRKRCYKSGSDGGTWDFPELKHVFTFLSSVWHMDAYSAQCHIGIVKHFLFKIASAAVLFLSKL